MYTEVRMCAEVRICAEVRMCTVLKKNRSAKKRKGAQYLYQRELKGARRYHIAFTNEREKEREVAHYL